ncbi:MAG: class I SAM-dependent methyltransferase [Chloroflexi bacterium]|nr:class I SAM-dependent methyltransferase [Chloroflexota bacterium]
MRPEIAQQLVDLNRRFYQSFADSFSETRRRLQPGVARMLAEIPVTASILDLGCGNGELARELDKHGHKGNYLGLDFSAGLLSAARAEAPEFARFMQADLSATDWGEGFGEKQYDFILAFAVLHHIPSKELRLQILEKARALLVPGGSFVHSNWQPLNSERLKARTQPWKAIGLSEADVDEGDYLMDWRRDGQGLRYVHQYGEDELAELAGETDFTAIETFYSDGEGGRLGLYGVWRKVE